jgi:hypothetical protein
MSSATPPYAASSPATPAVMRAAARAYDRARRIKVVSLAALGGGGAALLAATLSAAVAFLVGQRLQRR